MHDEKRSVRLTGTQLREILRQNRLMREILEAWPARQVMMGFEKDWDQRRRAFLEEHRPVSVGEEFKESAATGAAEEDPPHIETQR